MPTRFYQVQAQADACARGVHELFDPLASIDIVAHEFGHGITDFQIGWGNAGNEGAFNEGLSDIWGAIFEQTIRPSSTWQI